MKIVIANNKGGQGKTFFARLILWCLMKNPENTGKLAYLDTDKDQKNLADVMREADIKVFENLDEIPENMICVVDTPPSLTGSIDAIKAADILIVPIVLGKDSAKGVMRVREIRGKNDLRIVANDWDGGQNQKEVGEFLLANQFNIIGNLPRYKRISYNLDHDAEWYSGLTEPITNYILNLVRSLLAKPIG
jgi:cellulose biosynthesis protein BcsQ